jgi:hypothetical protein
MALHEGHLGKTSCPYISSLSNTLLTIDASSSEAQQMVTSSTLTNEFRPASMPFLAQAASE